LGGKLRKTEKIRKHLWDFEILTPEASATKENRKV